MAMKFSDLFPVIGFTAFVLWLLSTVMDGPLPAAIGIPNASSFFLPFHIPFLLLIGFCPRPLFDRLSSANCVLCAALTLALAWASPSAGRYILILLGASGAFMTIDACVALRRSSAPLLCAACGLVIANLLFIPLSAGAEGSWWQFAAVAAPLLAVPIFKQWMSEADPTRNGTSLWHYLPFIVVFQIVSGLMYAFLMPAYYQSALLPGFELLFYIAAVFLAFQIAQKNRDLALVFGVMSGMAAFALLYNGPSALRVNLSMFAMQAGAGFIDLAIIAVLLAFPKPVRAFGIGTAALCAGIVGGKIIGHYFADFSGAIVLTGNLFLNLSLLTLYFLVRYHYIGRPAAETSAAATRDPITRDEVRPTNPPKEPDPPKISIDSDPEPDDDNLPAHLRLLLSEREFVVLKRALAGSTYRETARELEISESTVKTYMYRIYEKMGVKRKKELFELLRNP